MLPKPSLARRLHPQLALQDAPLSTKQTHKCPLEMKLFEQGLIITLSDFLQRSSKAGTGKGESHLATGSKPLTNIPEKSHGANARAFHVAVGAQRHHLSSADRAGNGVPNSRAGAFLRQQGRLRQARRAPGDGARRPQRLRLADTAEPKRVCQRLLHPPGPLPRPASQSPSAKRNHPPRSPQNDPTRLLRPHPS